MVSDCLFCFVRVTRKCLCANAALCFFVATQRVQTLGNGVNRFHSSNAVVGTYVID